VRQRSRTNLFDYDGVSLEMPVHVKLQKSSRQGSAPPKVRFCLIFEREMLSVPVMRRVLGDTLRGIGVNEDSVADILLAATEACTNVVLHAGQSAPAYSVAATVDDGACRVEVSDVGRGCGARRRDDHGHRAPAREAFEHEAGEHEAGSNGAGAHAALAESGRGFAIMRACMDEVTLRSTPGRGTQVVLDKRIQLERRLAA
jgi:serine/threonine-protein kinase RsbW